MIHCLPHTNIGYFRMVRNLFLGIGVLFFLYGITTLKVTLYEYIFSIFYQKLDMNWPIQTPYSSVQ